MFHFTKISKYFENKRAIFKYANNIQTLIISIYMNGEKETTEVKIRE